MAAKIKNEELGSQVNRKLKILVAIPLAIIGLIAIRILCLTVTLGVSSIGCIKRVEYPYKVSVEQANEIIGASLPAPTYLPEGFQISDIYVLEKDSDSVHIVILISDTAANEMKPNDAKQVPQKIEMYVTLYRRGQVGGLKLEGEWFDIDGTKGVLVTKETSYTIWWILPYRQPPGQYELKLSAMKEIPKEELVKTARSVSH